MVYDAIVVGLGAMGSAAAWRMAARGARVLGLEQFAPGHAHGSSHGQTRIIRKAYFEHPDYVPLLHRSYALWAELEAAIARRLFERVGLLLLGSAESPLIAGVRRTAAIHGLAIDEISPAAITARFPGFAPSASHVGLFERDAGYLLVEESVRALASHAAACGATLLTDQRVEGWRVEGGLVTVATAGGTHRARRLVVCAGSWTGGMLEALDLPLRVARKMQLWFACGDARYGRAAGCPVFAFEDADGFFYGFPEITPGQVKIAEHTGIEVIAGPEALDGALRESDVARVRSFVRARLPGVGEQVVRHSACLYTMTPDGHFILDRHPDHEQVVLAAGFSGHGFKFAPLVGEVLADLALEGATATPIGFLRLERLRK